MSISLKEILNKEKLPSHIAVIMDGNGRWAREKGKDRIFGHQNGVRAVRQTAEACAELGISYLTLYAFSTENWNRPQHEVNALMELLVATIAGELKTLNDNNIALKAIGNLSKLPPRCREELRQAIEDTRTNTGLRLILALSYSARWDILNAARTFAASQPDMATIEALDENQFRQYLTTAEFPDPELLIRTSGEHRISNFLLWELAYTELHFCNRMWPDFEKEDLYKAILDYQNRERRFGMTSDQIKVK